MMGVACRETVWFRILLLPYIQGLDELSWPKIIELSDIIIEIVTRKQYIIFDIQTIGRYDWPINFPYRTTIDSYVPDMHSWIPTSSEKDVGIFGQTLHAEHSVRMVIGVQLTWSTCLVLLPIMIEVPLLVWESSYRIYRSCWYRYPRHTTPTVIGSRSRDRLFDGSRSARKRGLGENCTIWWSHRSCMLRSHLCGLVSTLLRCRSSLPSLRCYGCWGLCLR